MDLIPSIEENEEKQFLAIVWSYKIKHANKEIYDYAHLTQYEITDKNNSTLIEDLKYIISHSYSKMSIEFKQRPKEFKSLREMENLPANTISSILHQLQTILLPLHG